MALVLLGNGYQIIKMFVIYQWGIGLNGGATICHYPEQKHKVDYRYFKYFEAKIIDEKKFLSKKYSYYTRINNKNLRE